MEELKLLMETRFMMRRLKRDVLSQLPDKRREMVLLNSALVKSKTKEMQNQAKLISNNALTHSEWRGILLEWFHSTSSAKSPAVQEYIRDKIECGHKFLCFAHHNTMMSDIASTLEKVYLRSGQCLAISSLVLA